MENKFKLQDISNKKLLITDITLLVLNLICLIILTSRTGAYNLDGTYNEANSVYLIFSTLIDLILFGILISSILSALIAIFINKQQSYKKRFVRTFLFSILIV